MLSALVEGVNFWDQAFQAAGYPPGTFRAEVCPEDVDPYVAAANFRFAFLLLCFVPYHEDMLF